MIINRTLAVKDSFIKDIEKIIYWTTIVVQVMFFAYYMYSIYSNLNSLLFLVIYSLLLTLSSISFIIYIVNYNNVRNGSRRTLKFSFRISKYLINGSMIIINILEVLRYGGNNTAYGLIIFSLLSLMFQIILELLRGFITKYIDLFSIAVEKDTRKIRKIIEPKGVKGTTLAVVDASLSQISNKFEKESKELTNNELLVEELYTKRLEHNKTHKREKKNVYVNRQKNEIKNRLKIIKSGVVKRRNNKNQD